MSTTAIIAAAGRGTRLGGKVPKQYRNLGGEMVLTRTLRAALACRSIDAVLVAIHPDAGEMYAAAVAALDDPRLLAPVDGGAERCDTVRLALEALADRAPEVVLIHDAARPFASPALYQALADQARSGEGAIAAEPLTDALWRATDGMADAPAPRAGLWRAQTPQAFPYVALLAAHRVEGAAGGDGALDDAEVFRRAGGKVRLVQGEPENFKITSAADLARAELLVAARMSDVRVGHGFDVHRFCPGDQVWLCGVAVPHDRGLEGHSDADVGLHALADAIYGAIGEGDIGQHFPPSDPQWKGSESHIFLGHAAGRVAAHGGRIANVDVTLLCERPKIAPHAAAMKARIGELLGLAPDRVSIKATTMEGMGFVGREEGMGALATATVVLEASGPPPHRRGEGGAGGEGGA